MNLIVTLRIEQYPEVEGDEAKALDLVKHLVTLPHAVNESLVDAEVDAVCTAVSVDEEEEVESRRMRDYADKVPGGPPYKSRPSDGRRYVQGPGGWYPVPTIPELDAAEAEFRASRATPYAGISFVGVKGEQVDDK